MLVVGQPRDQFTDHNYYYLQLDFVQNGGLWIWSRFSCPCVRVCVHMSATISRTCMNQFYSYLVKHNKWWHTYVCHFVSRCDQRWPIGSHFSYKKNGVKHVLNHFSDIHLPILFNLGTQIMNDGLHAIFFQDQIQHGRLATILLLKCVPNNFSDRHSPISFNLGTSTVYDGIHVHLTLFCDLMKDGRLVDWLPF